MKRSQWLSLKQMGSNRGKLLLWITTDTKISGLFLVGVRWLQLSLSIRVYICVCTHDVKEKIIIALRQYSLSVLSSIQQVFKLIFSAFGKDSLCGIITLRIHTPVPLPHWNSMKFNWITMKNPQDANCWYTHIVELLFQRHLTDSHSMVLLLQHHFPFFPEKNSV